MKLSVHRKYDITWLNNLLTCACCYETDLFASVSEQVNESESSYDISRVYIDYR